MKGNENKKAMKVENKRRRHWAYEIAEQLIEKRPISCEEYKLQSSISPSGVIHIGNFRDTIVVWAVRRVLAAWKISSEFILNFDDADCVKSKLILEDQQKKPLSEVLIGKEKLGNVFSRLYIKELIDIGIVPDRILYQSDMYFNSKRYDVLIDKTLSSTKRIKSILNKYRRNKLNSQWMPLVVYCEKCKKQLQSFTVEKQLSFLKAYWEIKYSCEYCGYSFEGDLHKLRYKKLLWRVDWPMRCFTEKLDFEPCGIDHYVEGSTITTSAVVARKIFRSKAPLVFAYELVKMQGKSKKISSSAGDKFNLSIFNKLFPREIILWKFLSKKLMSPIIINPQEDFHRYYFEFERVMRNYDNGVQSSFEEEIMSLIDISKKNYYSNINIKLLTFVCQAFNFQYESILSFLCSYYSEVSKEDIKAELEIKLPRSKYWLENFAPERYKFQLTASERILPEHKKAADLLLKYIDNPKEKLLKENYESIYEILFNKNYGPRLKTIVSYWDKEKLQQHCLRISSSK